MGLDISRYNGIVTVYKDTKDDYSDTLLVSYSLEQLKQFSFNTDFFELKIGGESHRSLFTDLTIQTETPYDFADANEKLSVVFSPNEVNTTSGSFLSDDGKTITVESGLINSIEI